MRLSLHFANPYKALHRHVFVKCIQGIPYTCIQYFGNIIQGQKCTGHPFSSSLTMHCETKSMFTESICKASPNHYQVFIIMEQSVVRVSPQLSGVPQLTMEQSLVRVKPEFSGMPQLSLEQPVVMDHRFSLIKAHSRALGAREIARLESFGQRSWNRLVGVTSSEVVELTWDRLFHVDNPFLHYEIQLKKIKTIIMKIKKILL